MHEWRHEPLAVQRLCISMLRDDEHNMLRVARNARLAAGDGTVLFISPELSALGWAARAPVGDGHPPTDSVLTQRD